MPAYTGDVGWWHHPTLPVAMVQCHGAGEEEGWVTLVLHRLLLPQSPDQKGCLPLPRMQETMESMFGAGHFSCIDLKSGFWQVKMAEESRQYTAFMVGSMGVYEFPSHALRAVQRPGDIPMPHAKLSRGAKSHVCPN